ncbi:DUF3885 domain-containing protein [Tsukamurella conjunctivitidis]|uniref:DUF3885 domain-containing protein n=1 Tax=Tsukamurella conjunctivitidis TaxID=2592068 RepID=UPI003F696FB3
MGEGDGVRRPTAAEVAEFDAAWRKRFGDLPRSAQDLRSPPGGWWVRLHSLPESKQYPDSDEEYAELLRRDFAMLDELRGREEVLTVVTRAYSNSSRPVRRSTAIANLLPRPRYWRSVSEGYPNDEEQIWAHLYLHCVRRDAPVLHELFRLVAEWGVPEVVLTGSTWAWQHCPYDGGSDLMLETEAECDRVTELFAAWLPAW